MTIKQPLYFCRTGPGGGASSPGSNVSTVSTTGRRYLEWDYGSDLGLQYHTQGEAAASLSQLEKMAITGYTKHLGEDKKRRSKESSHRIIIRCPLTSGTLGPTCWGRRSPSSLTAASASSEAECAQRPEAGDWAQENRGEAGLQKPEVTSQVILAWLSGLGGWLAAAAAGRL